MPYRIHPAALPVWAPYHFPETGWLPVFQLALITAQPAYNNSPVCIRMDKYCTRRGVLPYQLGKQSSGSIGFGMYVGCMGFIVEASQTINEFRMGFAHSLQLR
ncbi:hypothetical protein NDU88_003100 [Pleurodeles waltl]|uniref:Uncharacterized protein n=1 Tax=Pleurodeles waltl TaxID=8319 RepID=A0AAV7UXI4_PLEWA|nr:hypothetical protein NDU88_003100 [Pleurodeles waltl]